MRPALSVMLDPALRTRLDRRLAMPGVWFRESILRGGMDELVLTVDDAPVRLDRYIAKHSADLSRSLVQRLIKEHRVHLNGQPARASDVPSPGDIITVALRALSPNEPTSSNAVIPSLCVLYEDEHLLVVDKPAGVVVHPGAGHLGSTLVDILLAYRPELARADLDPQRPGIVHRLDKDTSGLMVVAAHKDCQLALQAMFRARRVHKVYLALLRGRLVPERGAIEAPVGRSPRDRKKITIRPAGGRFARTEYVVREFLTGATYVEAMPLTGRTHQLRVHFASIGHPVVGDRTYGQGTRTLAQGIMVPRQFLHAWRLTFAHPISGAELSFTSQLPPDLAGILESLRAQARAEPNLAQPNLRGECV